MEVSLPVVSSDIRVVAVATRIPFPGVLERSTIAKVTPKKKNWNVMAAFMY